MVIAFPKVVRLFFGYWKDAKFFALQQVHNPAVYFFPLCALCEEEVADGDAGDDAGEVGEETAGDGMAGLGDTYGTEIDGQNIERGVGGTLEKAR